MLSKKEERRSFSNGPLRDQWEKRAQSMADQCKQEAEWKEKSSLKVLFSKWNYHWSLVSNGDFRKLTSGTDEAEKNKPKIKFKIVPPPPKLKPEPPLPSPPKKTASPKPRRVKRKVEVDVFRFCWRESWMSLKPPKYLYLKAKELKIRIPGFTTIELTNNRKYKPKGYGSEAEWVSPADKWSHSWKQVKSAAQLEEKLSFSAEEKQFQWDILFKRISVCKAEIEVYSLPVWAGTWKIMNFAFRQQKQNWDRIWPHYQQNLSNKFDKVQQLEEQDKPSDWEDSWKLSRADLEPKDTTDNETLTASSFSTEITVMRINDVFMPGWSDSWMLSAAPLEEEERHKTWSSCWGYRQQIRWCKASQESHHRHSAMLTRRCKTMHLLLTSLLDDEITDNTKWMEGWKTPKRWIKPEEDELNETQEEGEVEEMMDDTEEEEEEKEDEGEGVDEEEKEDIDENVEDKEDNKEESHEEIHDEEDAVNKKDEEDEAHKEEEDKDVDKEEESEEEDKEEGDKEVHKGKEEEEEEHVKENNEEDEVHKEVDVDKEEDKDKEAEHKEERDKQVHREEDKNINQNEEEDEDEDNEVEAEEEEEENEIKEEEKKDVEKEDKNKEADKDEDEEVDEKDEEEKLDKEWEKKEVDNKEEEEDEDVDEKEDKVDKEMKNGEVDENSVEEEDEEEEDEEDEADKDQGKEVDNKEEEEYEEADEEEEDEEVEKEGETDKEDSGVEEMTVKSEEDDDHEKVGEKEEDNEVEEKEPIKRKPDVPLHLQFHKLNTSFSSWKQSWMVAVAHRGGDEDEEEEEEEEEWWTWKESWKICRWKKLDEDEVVYFFMKHQNQKYMGLIHEEDSIPKSEWTLSWKMIKTAAKNVNTEEEEEEEEEES